MSKPEFRSEELEPMAALVTGRLWARVQWEIDNGNDITLRNELDNFWWGIQAIEKLAIATRGALHFSLASGNNVSHAQDLIEDLTGHRPEYTTGM